MEEKTLDGFKEKLIGVRNSFEWAIEQKKDKGLEIELEEVCVSELDLVLSYIKRYERGLL